MMRFTVLLLALCSWVAAQGQQAVFREISKASASGRNFQEASLLKFHSTQVQDREFQLDGLTQGTIMEIEHEALAALVSNRNEFVRLQVPVSERTTLDLVLMEHKILADDFELFTSDLPGIPAEYRPGVYYKGIVEGDPYSLVAVSVFNDEIMATISTKQGNFVLGKITQDRESRHIFYNDKDLERRSDFECSTADDGIPYTEEELSSNPGGRDVGDCVRVYIEIDDDIVTQKGGATPATNYITGLFNQSFVLYTNEDVTLTISEILAWTTNSPYTGSTSSQMLSSFQANSGDFNGNIGHLVSYQASGGIAVLDGMCQSNPDWRKCFSSIDATYQNVPTFSWSVMVVTHEMGHVIGSKHTHACVWNGNNTAIDGCAGSVEGSCPLPPIPPAGGTIMSYCHIQNVGIDFNLGFGPQPGNVIRNKVNASGNCLTTCGGGPPPPPPPPSYCSSNGNNSNYEYINKVVLNSINNTSGNNGGYGNYTGVTTNLTKGTSYTISLYPGFPSGSYVEAWKVWIDYNGDLDWNDAGELIGQGSGNSTVNINFTVPANNATVTTRLRVSMQYNAYPPNCGSFTYGEVEDYTVSVVASGGGTCNDGIQNQGETGIDCGGPCAPCPPEPSCNDGIQNQGETGVDCGGPCAPCPSEPSCTDGIQNQGETGIDCGGPCAPCPPEPSCNDGIQNQGETGIDCGGPCAPCPPPPPGGNEILLGSYFETGWDGWEDGGSDVHRVFSSNSYEGQYSIRLRDNGGVSSSMTSPSFNVSTGVIGLQFQFYFYAYGMENNEDFWLQYKAGNGPWVTIASFIKGVNFNNNIFYSATVTVPNFVPTSSASFRLMCDASDNADLVFIDQITITAIGGGNLIEEGIVIEEVDAPVLANPSLPNPEDEKTLSVYPNPVRDYVNLEFDGEIEAVRVIALDGQEMKVNGLNHNGKMVDISHLPQGIYFIWVGSEGQWYPAKFSKL